MHTFDIRIECCSLYFLSLFLCHVQHCLINISISSHNSTQYQNQYQEENNNDGFIDSYKHVPMKTAPYPPEPTLHAQFVGDDFFRSLARDSTNKTLNRSMFLSSFCFRIEYKFIITFIIIEIFSLFYFAFTQSTVFSKPAYAYLD